MGKFYLHSYTDESENIGNLDIEEIKRETSFFVDMLGATEIYFEFGSNFAEYAELYLYFRNETEVTMYISSNSKFTGLDMDELEALGLVEDIVEPPSLDAIFLKTYYKDSPLIKQYMEGDVMENTIKKYRLTFGSIEIYYGLAVSPTVMKVSLTENKDGLRYFFPITDNAIADMSTVDITGGCLIEVIDESDVVIWQRQLTDIASYSIIDKKVISTLSELNHIEIIEVIGDEV